MSTRLGVVSYLNTKPLVRAFETGAIEHDFELLFDLPSACARRLHAGETDVALIPSIEIARASVPYSVVPSVGITSLGPVTSVLLVHRTDTREIQSLALDNGSRTSAALVQIVLARQFGCRPTVFESVPDLDAMMRQADAALVIGDAALELDRKTFGVIDLGQAWTEMTGLPFVYACWTGRPDALTPQAASKLVQAKELGCDEIPAIAEAYASAHRHPPETYNRYLEDIIRYSMGEPELEGLNRYYAYAMELGLIDQAPTLGFYPVG
jgi:chorismate dehydratase